VPQPLLWGESEDGTVCCSTFCGESQRMAQCAAAPAVGRVRGWHSVRPLTVAVLNSGSDALSFED
jgi:hypothetical protein